MEYFSRVTVYSRLIKSRLLIVTFSFFVFYLMIPSGFNYNHDAYVSGDFLNIARTYRVVPFDQTNGIPGRISTGHYVPYTSWPPLFPLLLSFLPSNNPASVLLQARLWMVAISALTVLAFFNLLWSIYHKLEVALTGSMLYLFLPFQLLYSSLIACDMVVPLFYILIVHVYVKYIPDGLSWNGWLKVTGLALLGTFFSWQVFFILPAMFLVGLAIGRSWSWKVLFAILVVLLAVFLWFLWIRMHAATTTSGSAAFEQLKLRSLLFLIDGNGLIIFLIRLGKLIVGFIPLGLLVLLGSRDLVRLQRKISGKEKQAMFLLGTTLLLYLLVMPGMFAPHEFQFLLWFPFVVLACVVFITKKNRTIPNRSGMIIYVTLSLFVLLIIIPQIHSNGGKNKEFNQRVISMINERYPVNKGKLILVDDRLLTNSHDRFDIFAIQVPFQTNSYCHRVPPAIIEKILSDKWPGMVNSLVKRHVDIGLTPISKMEAIILLTKICGPSIGQKSMIRTQAGEEVFLYTMDNDS